MTPFKDQRGVVLFLTVLVMGTVSISVLLGLTQESINAIVDSHQQAESMKVRHVVYGCLDEVFLQLVGDSAWSSTSVTTTTAMCDVVMTPSGSNLDLLVTWSLGDITRGVTANITVSPFIVNQMSEALSL